MQEEKRSILILLSNDWAMSKYKVGSLKQSTNAIINKNVKSAMWLLERYDPDNYNLTTRAVEVIPNHMLSELEVDLEVSQLYKMMRTFEESFGGKWQTEACINKTFVGYLKH